MAGIIVVGAGKMGRPLIWSLYKLGHCVYVVEPQDHTKVDSYFKNMNQAISGCAIDINEFNGVKVDAVISAAPYAENYLIAQNCVVNHRRYADLGGNPDISKKISEMLSSADIPHITDLGLAPGLANIILEHGISLVKDIVGADIKIRVGGLPMHPNNYLKYNQVFSLEGLYNEYTGKCQIIRDHKVQEVDTLSELERVDFLRKTNEISTYEAFQTKGGLGNSVPDMFARGVASFDYKTIRYNGHCDAIKFLLNEVDLTREEFSSVISKTCPIICEDIVLISVVINHKKGTWLRRACIPHGEIWTAMQATTSCSAASVASLLAEGKLDDKPNSYSSVPTELFFDKLEKIRGFDVSHLR